MCVWTRVAHALCVRSASVRSSAAFAASSLYPVGRAHVDVTRYGRCTQTEFKPTERADFVRQETAEVGTNERAHTRVRTQTHNHTRTHAHTQIGTDDVGGLGVGGERHAVEAHSSWQPTHLAAADGAHPIASPFRAGRSDVVALKPTRSRVPRVPRVASRGCFVLRAVPRGCASDASRSAARHSHGGRRHSAAQGSRRRRRARKELRSTGIR